jgi:hypothetical protein
VHHLSLIHHGCRHKPHHSVYFCQGLRSYQCFLVRVVACCAAGELRNTSAAF